MDTYKLILKRRSIRRFKPDNISFDILKKLVNTGRLAPSAANLQPIEYIIIEDNKIKSRVFKTLKWAGYISPAGNPPAGQEPAAYIVLAVNTDIKPTGADKDVGAACENIILSALSYGIGSCWIESMDKAELQKILQVPDRLIINSVIALGYPNEQPMLEELSDPYASIEYWKDDNGCLHVPKRRLDDILYHNTYPAAEEIKWEIAWNGSEEEEAYLIKGFLENNNIPCVLETSKFHEIPVNFSLLSQIRIMTPEDKTTRARELIHERNTKVECPDCGTLNPTDNPTCKSCSYELN